MSRPRRASPGETTGVARDCIVGLDIGTTKVCTVVAEVEERGQVNIIGMGNSPSGGIRKGVVVDIESATAAIVDSVEKARAMSGVDIRRVVVGVTGEHVRLAQLAGRGCHHASVTRNHRR